MKHTIQDVASVAGVSMTTVSRVLNNNYPVKKETREKVEKAILQLDFTPNSLARGLIQKKTRTVGVLVPSITNLFFPLVVNGLQHYFQTMAYTLLLCDTGGEADVEMKHLQNLLERRVDGIIAIDPPTVHIHQYEKITKDIPVVLINGFHDGIQCNFVLNNQEAGTIEALEYLIGLGHKNICFVRGTKSYSYDLKEDIYRMTLEKHHILLYEENVVTIENGNSIAAMETAAYAVSKRLEMGNRPSAVFCCNDWMATGVFHAAQSLGFAIPQALSVIGYDNIIISEMSMPKLTTVDQNMYRLGRVSAQRLHELMNGESLTFEKIHIETKLIVRDSCTRVHEN